jgi:ligand-binding SRPBCC domain-containing protein
MIYAPVCRLEYEQVLPLTLADAWDFFSRPENLAEITPQNLSFEVTSPLPGRMYAGMIVNYRVRPFAGIVVPWTTEITHVVEPFFFVDEQRSGPYRLWHHQHRFAQLDGRVLMTDLVHYQLGFGPLAHYLAGGMVRRRLEEIFNYRRQKLCELFGREDSP